MVRGLAAPLSLREVLQLLHLQQGKISQPQLCLTEAVYFAWTGR